QSRRAGQANCPVGDRQAHQQFFPAGVNVLQRQAVQGKFLVFQGGRVGRQVEDRRVVHRLDRNNKRVLGGERGATGRSQVPQVIGQDGQAGRAVEVAGRGKGQSVEGCVDGVQRAFEGHLEIVQAVAG